MRHGGARPAGGQRLLALLVVAGLLGGCQTRPAASPPASTTATGSHQPAPIRFAGQQATKTEPFLLAGGLTMVGAEHRGRGSFRVEILTNEGEPQRILFLASGRYRGSTGLGLPGGIYRLTVAADAPWKLEITQPRNRTGAALPQRYQGASDTLIGPVRVDGDLRVNVAHAGQGDLSVELLSDEGPSLYFLVEESGPFTGWRTAAGLQPGDYYLNVEARHPWRLVLHPG
jgi:hypothetical protein